MVKKEKFIVPYLLKGSSYGKEEIAVIKDLLSNQETLSCGQQRDCFDKEFAKFLGVKHAISVTNCTIALEFATYLLNLKEHDEVIATPFTYQASIQPLLTKPICIKFCDIDPNSLCADVESIRKLISGKTKAIFITHYGGGMVEMDGLMHIARAHNLLVVEDCAHAIGSIYKGKKAGATADIGCFSFQSSKNISTMGEGGMITCNNNKWAKIIKNIRANEPDCTFIRKTNSFAQNAQKKSALQMHDKNAYTHDCTKILHSGTNATLSEPAAAVGRCQLRKLDLFNCKRREIAHWLDNNLSLIDEVAIQQVANNTSHTHHLYVFFLRYEYKINRDAFITYLYNQGIEIVLRYFPIHLLPEWRYRGGYYGQCPITERIWFKTLVNLPCYPGINETQLKYMVEKIKEGLIKCTTTKKIFYS